MSWFLPQKGLRLKESEIEAVFIALFEFFATPLFLLVLLALRGVVATAPTLSQCL